MTTTYAALDLATTGLDSTQDAIIEIAVVVFDDRGVRDEWSALVNPDQEVPTFITRLTGITQAMVDGEPDMYAVRSRLRAIVGNHPVVGHNIDFDLSFLAQANAGLHNHRFDTLTLSTILLPGAGRYELDYLADILGLEADGSVGRALPSAHRAMRLFQALQKQARGLDRATLEEIITAGRRSDWAETHFFEEVLANGGGQGRVTGWDARARRLFSPPKPEGQHLVPADDPRRIDTTLLSGMLQPGGNLSRSMPGFEHRQQQVEMMEAVADAFNNEHHLLVEAGTGTGKSMAYLLPAAFWAGQNQRRVVISTNTINLQDQLLQKDIPQLQKILPFRLQVAVRKGRSNYLCTRLFQQLRHSGPSNADEMTLYAKLLLWLPQTETGDVAELNLHTFGERMAWAHLNAENVVCRIDDCAQEGCPLHLARRRAELAHIVVVNHALLLSDVASNNMILPEFSDLIIDEAHHLEAAVTDGLSFRADARFLGSLLDEITGTRSGQVADLQSRLAAVEPLFRGGLDDTIVALRQTANGTVLRLEEFFDALSYFMDEHLSGRNDFAQQLRLVPSLRILPSYGEVALSWENLSRTLSEVSKGVLALADKVGNLHQSVDVEDGEELQLALTNTGRLMEETRAQIEAIINKPKDEMIYWLERQRDRISLHAAPLHIGPLVEEHIFRNKETVILTSATLRTADLGNGEEPGFGYLRHRLCAHDAGELAVGSPFDYPNSTLLYLCTDIPEPNQPRYSEYVQNAIVDVAKALGGRTMVLFTSYGQLNATTRAIRAELREADIALLSQGESVSRQQLLEQFQQPNARAVLLGTRSFWEGVDVPGDALQAVLIAKLPFDVPSDPIFAARAETFGNPFMEYSVPEAVLRFRQGFGRLIRRRTDEGVVAILDRRVLTKRYGNLFVEALPGCMLLRQRTSRLGEITLRWLNRAK